MGVEKLIKLHRFFWAESPKYAGQQPLWPTLVAYTRFMLYSLRDWRRL